MAVPVVELEVPGKGNGQVGPFRLHDNEELLEAGRSSLVVDFPGSSLT
jgi:hypothetical protein